MFTVKDIQEDLDFGCEERPEGEKRRAIVILEDEEGKLSRFPMEDELLTKRDICPGDVVRVDEEGRLAKA